jgi:hypothetical protein
MNQKRKKLIKKIQYQYQLGCSKVDTRPTLVQKSKLGFTQLKSPDVAQIAQFTSH